MKKLNKNPAYAQSFTIGGFTFWHTTKNAPTNSGDLSLNPFLKNSPKLNKLTKKLNK